MKMLDMKIYNLWSTIKVGVLVFVVILICVDNVTAKEDIRMELKQVSPEKWKALESKRIFFGHQSVGNNILDGVRLLMAEMPDVKFNIVKLANSADYKVKGNGGIFCHANVGENFDPSSKVDDFARWINRGLGGHVDIAFMKFCYVDIGTQMDLQSLFNHYKKTLAELKAKYPDTTFIHFTVPIMSELTGMDKWKHELKGVIKKIIGKYEFYENVNKYAFNEMIRAEYKGKEPLFDLAAVESTFPDGRRSTFSDSGKSIESMVPEYTEDGGHLAPLGKKIVAENLLFFLVNLD